MSPGERFGKSGRQPGHWATERSPTEVSRFLPGSDILRVLTWFNGFVQWFSEWHPLSFLLRVIWVPPKRIMLLGMLNTKSIGSIIFGVYQSWAMENEHFVNKKPFMSARSSGSISIFADSISGECPPVAASCVRGHMGNREHLKQGGGPLLHTCKGKPSSTCVLVTCASFAFK